MNTNITLEDGTAIEIPGRAARPQIRIWKLGSLEHKILVGPGGFRKLRDALLQLKDGGDLIWDAAIDVQTVEVVPNGVDVIVNGDCLTEEAARRIGESLDAEAVLLNGVEVKLDGREVIEAISGDAQCDVGDEIYRAVTGAIAALSGVPQADARSCSGRSEEERRCGC